MEATFDAFLAVLMERLDKRFEQADKRVEQVRLEMDKRFEQARIEMIAVVDHMADTLREEMRELSKTDLQAIRDDLKNYDDKYTGLPGRVTRLEAAVFKPRPKTSFDALDRPPVARAHDQISQRPPLIDEHLSRVAARPVDSLRRRATPARLRGKTRAWLTYVSMQS